MNAPPLIPSAAVLIGRHGWTLADAERIAGRAARDHPSSLLSHADRREAAVHAVTEAVLSAGEHPPLLALLRAASDAISTAVRDERHHRGMSVSGPGATAPRFARYWTSPPQAGLFEDDLTDSIAVHQVLAGIRPSWRRDLEALAEHGTYEAAAAALGTTPVTFRSRLSKARAAASELWFSPDSAPGMWGADRRTGGARSRAVTHCVRARTRDRLEQAARETADAA